MSEGRDPVNYSEFDQPQDEADETIEVLLDGEMPPGYYTRFGLHPEANLTRERGGTGFVGCPPRRVSRRLESPPVTMTQRRDRVW